MFLAFIFTLFTFVPFLFVIDIRSIKLTFSPLPSISFQGRNGTVKHKTVFEERFVEENFEEERIGEESFEEERIEEEMIEEESMQHYSQFEQNIQQMKRMKQSLRRKTIKLSEIGTPHMEKNILVDDAQFHSKSSEYQISSYENEIPCQTFSSASIENIAALTNSSHFHSRHEKITNQLKALDVRTSASRFFKIGRWVYSILTLLQFIIIPIFIVYIIINFKSSIQILYSMKNEASNSNLALALIQSIFVHELGHATAAVFMKHGFSRCVFTLLGGFVDIDPRENHNSTTKLERKEYRSNRNPCNLSQLLPSNSVASTTAIWSRSSLNKSRSHKFTTSYASKLQSKRAIPRQSLKEYWSMLVIAAAGIVNNMIFFILLTSILFMFSSCLWVNRSALRLIPSLSSMNATSTIILNKVNGHSVQSIKDWTMAIERNADRYCIDAELYRKWKKPPCPPLNPFSYSIDQDVCVTRAQPFDFSRKSNDHALIPIETLFTSHKCTTTACPNFEFCVEIVSGAFIVISDELTSSTNETTQNSHCTTMNNKEHIVDVIASTDTLKAISVTNSFPRFMWLLSPWFSSGTWRDFQKYLNLVAVFNLIGALGNMIPLKPTDGKKIFDMLYFIFLCDRRKSIPTRYTYS